MSGGWAGGQPRAGGSRGERTPGPCWKLRGLGRRVSMCSASSAGASPRTPHPFHRPGVALAGGA
eukprot:1721272-Alexandrium_andersonii.AAC.1